MKHRNIIIGLGFLIIILPALYFPQDFRNALSVLAGASVAVLSYLSGKEKKKEVQNGEAPISNQ